VISAVTELLPVRITQTEIFVYGQDLKLVAQHELRPRGAGELVIAPGHRPKPDRGPGLDQLRVVYRELGDGADLFLVELERIPPPHLKEGRTSCIPSSFVPSPRSSRSPAAPRATRGAPAVRGRRARCHASPPAPLPSRRRRTRAPAAA
jgi:hypothetical protein